MSRLRRPSHVLLAALLAIAVTSCLRIAGLLEPIELAAYDRLAPLARAVADSPARTVVVGIDEADLTREGWPISDGALARLLERLLAAGAVAVGVDVYRDRPVPPGTGVLDRLLRDRPQVVWAMRFAGARGGAIAAPVAVERDAQVGFVDQVSDGDGVVRRGLLFLDDGGPVAHAMALRLAAAFLAGRGVVPEAGPHDPAILTLGAASLAPLRRGDGGYAALDHRGYQFLLSHGVGAPSVPALSMADALALEAGTLSGRVALVGVAARSVPDDFLSAWGPAGQGREPVRGLWLHAQATDQIVRMALGEERSIVAVSRRTQLAGLALLALFGASVGACARRPGTVAAWLGAGALATLAACTLALRSGFWPPAVEYALTVPVAGLMAMAFPAFPPRGPA